MKNEQFIAGAILGIAIILYIRHKTKPGSFNNKGGYENISPLKHDIYKHFVLSLFPFLMQGLLSNGPLWDSKDPLNSQMGNILIGAVAHIVYYHLVEPYIANKTPNY